MIVNIGAVCHLLVLFVFVFFPVLVPVTPASMNWNVVIFGATMSFAVVYYAIWGRHTYHAPVYLVRRTEN